MHVLSSILHMVWYPPAAEWHRDRTTAENSTEDARWAPGRDLNDETPLAEFLAPGLFVQHFSSLIGAPQNPYWMSAPIHSTSAAGMVPPNIPEILRSVKTKSCRPAACRDSLQLSPYYSI